MLSQITQVLDVKPVANVSPRWNVNRPIQAVLGAFQIGDHGPEYEYQKPSPAEHRSILNCGCSILFPVPTRPGELLFCGRHDDWFKSAPVVKPADLTHFVKCQDCPKEYGPYRSSHAFTTAKRHAFGKNGNRTPPHTAFVGKSANDEIIWTEYKRRGN